MKKEIRIADEERGIIQVTTIDERFYAFQSTNSITGLPTYIYKPSVTYVTGFYPKGKFFEAWLRNNGNEAEVIKQLAAEKGSKVHQGCDSLVKGNTVTMASKFINPTTGNKEELTTEEYEAILSFARWCDAAKPKFLNSEFIIEGPDFAGTVDLLCEIAGKTCIIDYKTSQVVYPSHELQVSAYKHAMGIDADMAILQLGYKKNKNGYKLTPVDDKYDLFRNVYQIFLNETEGEKPRQIELPMSIKLESKEKKNAEHKQAVKVS